MFIDGFGPGLVDLRIYIYRYIYILLYTHTIIHLLSIIIITLIEKPNVPLDQLEPKSSPERSELNRGPGKGFGYCC